MERHCILSQPTVSPVLGTLSQICIASLYHLCKWARLKLDNCQYFDRVSIFFGIRYVGVCYTAGGKRISINGRSPWASLINRNSLLHVTSLHGTHWFLVVSVWFTCASVQLHFSRSLPCALLFSNILDASDWRPPDCCQCIIGSNHKMFWLFNFIFCIQEEQCLVNSRWLSIRIS